MAYVKIETPRHSDEFDREMRRIPGALFNSPAAKGAWIAPKEQLPAVRELKQKHFGTTAGTVTREMAQAAISRREGEGFERRQIDAAYAALGAGDYAAVLSYLR